MNREVYETNKYEVKKQFHNLTQYEFIGYSKFNKWSIFRISCEFSELSWDIKNVFTIRDVARPNIILVSSYHINDLKEYKRKIKLESILK